MNGDKCGFGLTVLKFFGHKLSSNGVVHARFDMARASEYLIRKGVPFK